MKLKLLDSQLSASKKCKVILYKKFCCIGIDCFLINSTFRLKQKRKDEKIKKRLPRLSSVNSN